MLKSSLRLCISLLSVLIVELSQSCYSRLESLGDGWMDGENVSELVHALLRGLWSGSLVERLKIGANGGMTDAFFLEVVEGMSKGVDPSPMTSF